MIIIVHKADFVKRGILMGENNATTVKGPSSTELALALALGWAAAELVGRYRHGIHPRNPAAAKGWEGRQVPRLSYSSRALRSNNDLFWLLAQRMLVLSEELGLDDLEGKDVVVPFVRGLFLKVPDVTEWVKAPSVSDWLTIGGLVAAGGGLLVSAGVWLFRRLGDIYRWLRDEFTDLLVRRRTVIPWR